VGCLRIVLKAGRLGGSGAKSGVPAVGPRGVTISWHPGLSSIGLSTARHVSIARVIQLHFNPGERTPRPDSSGGCYADVA
jgi:hypothetical protein